MMETIQISKLPFLVCCKFFYLYYVHYHYFQQNACCMITSKMLSIASQYIIVYWIDLLFFLDRDWLDTLDHLNCSRLPTQFYKPSGFLGWVFLLLEKNV